MEEDRILENLFRDRPEEYKYFTELMLEYVASTESETYSCNLLNYRDAPEIMPAHYKWNMWCEISEEQILKEQLNEFSKDPWLPAMDSDDDDDLPQTVEDDTFMQDLVNAFQEVYLSSAKTAPKKVNRKRIHDKDESGGAKKSHLNDEPPLPDVANDALTSNSSTFGRIQCNNLN